MNNEGLDEIREKREHQNRILYFLTHPETLVLDSGCQMPRRRLATLFLALLRAVLKVMVGLGLYLLFGLLEPLPPITEFPKISISPLSLEPESKPDNQPKPTPKPNLDPDSNPKSKPKHDPKPNPDPIPIPKRPEPKPIPNPKPKHDPKPNSDPKPIPRHDPEPKPIPKHDPNPKHDPDPEHDPEPKPIPKHYPKPKPDPKHDPDPKHEPKHDLKSKPLPKPKPDPKTKPNPKPKPDPKHEPKHEPPPQNADGEHVWIYEIQPCRSGTMRNNLETRFIGRYHPTAQTEKYIVGSLVISARLDRENGNTLIIERINKYPGGPIDFCSILSKFVDP